MTSTYNSVIIDQQLATQSKHSVMLAHSADRGSAAQQTQLARHHISTSCLSWTDSSREGYTKHSPGDGDGVNMP